jgi:hypothetical protein
MKTLDPDFLKKLHRILSLVKEDSNSNKPFFSNLFTYYGLNPENLDNLVANIRSDDNIYDNTRIYYVKWVYNNFKISPTQIGINNGVFTRPLLIFFLENGLYPDQEIVRLIIKKNKLDILKLLGKYNIYPNETNIDYAIKKKHYKILKWCIKHKLYPTYQGINMLNTQKKYKLLESININK